MNEEQLGPLVSTWLKEGNRPPTDPTASVRTAMNAATKTRQRSRWRWLPPFVHRMPDQPSEPHAVAETNDYQPSPIPATNGHTPTLIGRTQSMLSPVKAITAGALVFAIGGAFLIAQPFQQPSRGTPSAVVDPCTTPIVPVTGEIIWGYEQAGTQTFESSQGRHIRDFVYISTLAVDDDRLNGKITGAIDWDTTFDEQGAALAGVNHGTERIENEAGTWEGTFTGIGWTRIPEWRAVIDLTGTGAYDGLSARLFTESSMTSAGPVQGVIYPTDLASCDFSTGE